MRHEPDHVILHIGTNDLNSKAIVRIYCGIDGKSCNVFENRTEQFISFIILRTDNKRDVRLMHA